MSETHECEKARDKFIKFLQGLDACRPACAGLYEPDCGVEASVHVDRTEALDCFLRSHPSCERFRDALATVRRDVANFLFKKESWKKASED